MTSSNNQSAFLLGLLGIAFVVLKLCKVIGWSWWWVTAPFWAGAVPVVAATVLVVAFAVLDRRR